MEEMERIMNQCFPQLCTQVEILEDIDDILKTHIFKTDFGSSKNPKISSPYILNRVNNGSGSRDPR